MHRIALLGSPGVPTVGHFYREIGALGFEVTLVRNAKQESEKDTAIWRQRTGGRLPEIGIGKVPTIDIESISSWQGVLTLRDFDLAINGGLIEILKPDALGAPRLGVLNVHPGVLPKYRGSCAVEWALYNGDPVGVTAHIMDAGIDTGPIVAIRHVDCKQCRDYQDVRVATFRTSFALAAEAASLLLRGAVTPTPQGDGTYWRPMDNERMNAVIAASKR